MIKTHRQQASVWTILLLLSLLAAQSLLAEHIHIKESELAQCELGFNHVPAAVGSKFKFTYSRQTSYCRQLQTSVLLSVCPQWQNARAPPAAL